TRLRPGAARPTAPPANAARVRQRRPSAPRRPWTARPGRLDRPAEAHTGAWPELTRAGRGRPTLARTGQGRPRLSLPPRDRDRNRNKASGRGGEPHRAIRGGVGGHTGGAARRPPARTRRAHAGSGGTAAGLRAPGPPRPGRGPRRP